MSEDKQVNQPQNDVQEAEVKQTQTDEKPTPTFNQEDIEGTWEIESSQIYMKFQYLFNFD